MTRVVIVGLGDEAHALAHIYNNYNSSQSGNTLEVTKPHTKEGGTFHNTGVPVSEFCAALEHADVVIPAIPAANLPAFMNHNMNLLRGKIIVDLTNSWNPGEDLNSVLATTKVQFVKAFNDLGAVDLLSNSPTGKGKIHSKMCSKYPEAINVVKDFAETSLGMNIKIIPYEQYSQIAQHQNSLGGNWMEAAQVILAIFIVTEMYAIVRYNVLKGYDWFHLPLQVTNKAVCWTALWGLALSMLPGVLARLSNAISGNSLKTKPSWLRSFLDIRKHLGLIALWFLMIHIIMSLLIFSPAYYGRFFDESNGKLNSIGENSFFFGILGTGFYVILGICSLSSVGSEMTSKQWQLVFGPVAWLALVFGTVHVLIIGVKGWTDQETWPGCMPPITMTSTVIPLFVMFIKVVQMIFTRFVGGCVHHKGPNAYKMDTAETVVPDLAIETGDIHDYNDSF